MNGIINRPFVFAIFAALSLGASAAQTGAAQPQFSTIRNTPQFRYYRALFPADAAVRNFNTKRVMTAAEATDAAVYLQAQFDEILRSETAQQSSIAAALRQFSGLNAASSVARPSVKITFEDAFRPYAQTVSEHEILVSALVSRGLMLGSLDQAQNGAELMSQSLRHWYLNPADAPAISAAESAERVRTLLDTIENARFDSTKPDLATMKQKRPDLLGLQSPVNAVASFRERLKRYAQGETVPNYDAGVITQIYNFIDMHFDPAQRFMMAHELGHIVLGHPAVFASFPQDGSALTPAQCAAAQAMENAADAFAIVTLVYGKNGDMELLGRDYITLDSNRDITSDEAWFNPFYGYQLLMRYAFSEAGLNQTIGPGCPYPAAEQRIAHVTALRKAALQLRRASFAVLTDSLRRDPPYFGSLKTHKLDVAEQSALLEKLASHCLKGRSQPDEKLKAIGQGSAYLYGLSCHASPEPLDEQTRLGIGPASYAGFQGLYTGTSNLEFSWIFASTLTEVSLKAEFGKITYTSGETR